MIDRRFLLKAGLATLAAPAIIARAETPKAIRIAGGVNFAQGQLQLTGYAAIIQHQGWLAAELDRRGVKLEPFAVSHKATGPQINEGFANGSLEFASYGDLPTIICNANGVQTRLLVPNGMGGSGDTFLVVPAGSTAKDVTDLKGKRIAVHRGRPWEIPFFRLLAAKGLSPSDFTILNIDPMTGAAAVSAGKVDGLFTMTDAYLLEEKGVARILWSSKGLAPEWKMRTEMFGRKDFVETQPELTQLVTTAYVKAAHWASDPANRDMFLEFQGRTGTPRSVLDRTYDEQGTQWRQRWAPLFAPDLAERYQETVQYALDNKLIRQKIDGGKLLAPSFTAKALKDLGLEGYWQAAA
ncbi:ABC transporter substrate-binding protein [Niveispirillum sp. KHB5.9]|uniref:ABC transporter substrate-binding protein n=1 Tax=Niveispirillum sp. KHB5.9 TaxID=3400269 RepID=UPI003A8831B0